MNPNKDSINAFLSKLQNGDEKIRATALGDCINLGEYAVKPLVELIDKSGFETARMAKRCLWKIVRYSSSPGNEDLRKHVCAQLNQSINNCSSELKREILWMFSEIGNDESVSIVSQFLTDKELRDDARCALQRMSSKNALSALKNAFKNATDDFKYALADSLRANGIKIKGYQSKKLVPTRQTNIGKKA